MSEDITWCMDWGCACMKCERNPKHIKLPIDHSYALLEGTEDCYKTQNRGEDDIKGGDGIRRK